MKAPLNEHAYFSCNITASKLWQVNVMSISDVISEKINVNVIFDSCSVLIKMQMTNAFPATFTVMDVMLTTASVINCSGVKNETSSMLLKNFYKLLFISNLINLNQTL